jgi:peptide/nickel transport system permease protein
LAKSTRERGTGRYVLGRVGQALFVLWAAYTLSYLILWSLPGNVIGNITGGSATDLSKSQIEQIETSWGLNKPLPLRYVESLGNALHGNFGLSFTSQQPVTQVVLQSVPPTLEIAGLGFAFAVIFGTGIALLATRARWRWLSNLFLALPPLGIAIPSFWLGLLLIQFFSFALPLFPSSGNGGFSSLILPAITLGVPTSALIAQLLASGLQRALDEPYADTARAKGASPGRVQLRHAFRNAVLPALTISGLVVGGLLAGSVVTETVFSRNGLGRVTAAAVSAQDVPVVQGVVVFVSIVFVVVNLIVDLIYPLLDPRIATIRRRVRRPRLQVREA